MTDCSCLDKRKPAWGSRLKSLQAWMKCRITVELSITILTCESVGEIPNPDKEAAERLQLVDKIAGFDGTESWYKADKRQPDT